MTARNCFKTVIKVFKVLSILALLLCIAAKILICHATTKNKEMATSTKAFNIVTETGFLLIIICLIISEFEPKWFIEYCYFLHFWFIRGFFQAWLGAQTITSAKTVVETVKKLKLDGFDGDTVQTFIIVTGYTLLCIGSTYMIFALFCLRAATHYGTSMEELEEGLISDDGKPERGAIVVGRHSTDMDRLIANMAKALGITDPKNAMKYYGPSAKDRPPPIPGTAKATATAAAGTVGAVMAQAALETKEAKKSFAPVGAAFDDEISERRKAMDEELDARYYASRPEATE